MTWANHGHWLWTRVPNPSFFVSVADDEDAEDMRLIQKAMPLAPFYMEKVVQPQIEEPTNLPLCKWQNANPTASTPQSILKQLWSLSRAWDFVKESSQVEFSTVIRIRPDITFAWLGKAKVQPNTCLTPWFSRWGGVNDRFAVMPPDVADVYFRAFEARFTLWDNFCPLHTESMIGRNLDNNGVLLPHSLAAYFMIVRKDGNAILPNMNDQDFGDYCRGQHTQNHETH